MAPTEEDMMEGMSSYNRDLYLFLRVSRTPRVFRCYQHVQQLCPIFRTTEAQQTIHAQTKALEQLAANNRRRKDVYLLPKGDQDVLDKLGYKEKLDAVDKAILVNAQFLSEIVSDTKIFGLESQEEDEDSGVGAEHGQTHSHSHSQGELNLWFSVAQPLLKCSYRSVPFTFSFSFSFSWVLESTPETPSQ